MNEWKSNLIRFDRFNSNQNFMLDRNFFKRRDVKIIESMPGGKELILFYIKLLCECHDGDGKANARGQIHNDSKRISALTNTPYRIVVCGLDMFEQCGMIKRENGMICITGGYYND